MTLERFKFSFKFQNAAICPLAIFHDIMILFPGLRKSKGFNFQKELLKKESKYMQRERSPNRPSALVER